MFSGFTFSVTIGYICGWSRHRWMGKPGGCGLNLLYSEQFAQATMLGRGTARRSKSTRQRVGSARPPRGTLTMSSQNPLQAPTSSLDGTFSDAFAGPSHGARFWQPDRLIQIARLSTGDALLAGLVHELNQPLGAMANYAQVGLHALESGAKSGTNDVRKPLNRIVEQADRAGQITRRLRRLIDREDFDPSPTAINSLVQQTASLLRGLERFHQTRVELVLADGLPNVTADRMEIMLVITALVKNAMEAMTQIPPESRTVVIRTALGEGEEIEIGVEDAGPGLDADDLDRIFLPFYTTKPKSIGLGLPLCRSIVARHGGRIEAISKPAGGGTCRFTLPVARKGAGS